MPAPPPLPDNAVQNQQLFLPLVKNLSGTALGSPGGMAALVLVVLGSGGGIV